jgi:hypothetical protein
VQRPFTRLRRHRPRTGFIGSLNALTLKRHAFYIGAVPIVVGPYGGTGRRVRLKIGFRKECWFDSG